MNGKKNYLTDYSSRFFYIPILFSILITHHLIVPFLPEFCVTYWIDVGQSNENLLVAGGTDFNVKIFDKRQSKVLRAYDDIHSSTELICLTLCQQQNYTDDLRGVLPIIDT